MRFVSLCLAIALHCIIHWLVSIGLPNGQTLLAMIVISDWP